MTRLGAPRVLLLGALADPVGLLLQARVGVLDRDPEACPREKLDVVLAVAEGDSPLRREAEPLSRGA